MRKKLVIGGLTYWAGSTAVMSMLYRRDMRKPGWARPGSKHKPASPAFVAVMLPLIAPVAVPFRAYDAAKALADDLAYQLDRLLIEINIAATTLAGGPGEPTPVLRRN